MHVCQTWKAVAGSLGGDITLKGGGGDGVWTLGHGDI